jgi:hypothetical protein
VPVPPGADLPVGGTTRELLQQLHERFLGENSVHMWMSVSGAIAVASSLGAASLETERDMRWSVFAFGGRRWPGCGLLCGGGSSVVVLKKRKRKKSRQ